MTWRVQAPLLLFLSLTAYDFGVAAVFVRDQIPRKRRRTETQWFAVNEAFLCLTQRASASARNTRRRRWICLFQVDVSPSSSKGQCVLGSSTWFVKKTSLGWSGLLFCVCIEVKEEKCLNVNMYCSIFIKTWGQGCGRMRYYCSISDTFTRPSLEMKDRLQTWKYFTTWDPGVCCFIPSGNMDFYFPSQLYSDYYGIGCAVAVSSLLDCKFCGKMWCVNIQSDGSAAGLVTRWLLTSNKQRRRRRESRSGLSRCV